MAGEFTYTPADFTDRDRVRLLLNDIDEESPVFDDDEIGAFLALEGNHVKLAAAQAIDTNADNELLASKVLKTQDLSTDGAKLADALHKRAQMLRDQHYATVEDDGFFAIIETGPSCGPEHTAGSWY